MQYTFTAYFGKLSNGVVLPLLNASSFSDYVRKILQKTSDFNDFFLASRFQIFEGPIIDKLAKYASIPPFQMCKLYQVSEDGKIKPKKHILFTILSQINFDKKK